MKPLFFLFTCVKDGSQCIGKLFDSLIAQSQHNFIHFIFDNGSDKTCENEVEAYKEKVSKLDEPFKVIFETTNEKIGLNKATEYCIGKCCCPFFIWIDSDNWVDTLFFENMTSCAERNPKADVIRSQIVEVNEKGEETTHYFKTQKWEMTKNKTNYQELIIADHYVYSFFAVNHSLLKKHYNKIVLFKDSVLYNDQQVMYLMSKISSSFVYCENAIGYFLRRLDSESSLPRQGFPNYPAKLLESYEQLAVSNHCIFPSNHADLCLVRYLDVKYSASIKNKDYKAAFKCMEKRKEIWANHKALPKKLMFSNRTLLILRILAFCCGGLK